MERRSSAQNSRASWVQQGISGDLAKLLFLYEFFLLEFLFDSVSRYRDLLLEKCILFTTPQVRIYDQVKQVIHPLLVKRRQRYQRITRIGVLTLSFIMSMNYFLVFGTVKEMKRSDRQQNQYSTRSSMACELSKRRRYSFMYGVLRQGQQGDTTNRDGAAWYSR